MSHEAPSSRRTILRSLVAIAVIAAIAMFAISQWRTSEPAEWRLPEGGSRTASVEHESRGPDANDSLRLSSSPRELEAVRHDPGHTLAATSYARPGAHIGEDLARLPHRLRGAPPGRVVVRVVDAIHGRPLRRFSVRAEAPGLVPSSVPGEDGRSEIAVPTAIPFNVMVDADGYESVGRRQVRVRDPESRLEVVVRLRPRSGR